MHGGQPELPMPRHPTHPADDGVPPPQTCLGSHIPSPFTLAGGRWRCLEACLLRARLNLSLLDRLDVVGRTSELARAFGIDFFSGMVP